MLHYTSTAVPGGSFYPVPFSTEMLAKTVPGSGWLSTRALNFIDSLSRSSFTLELGPTQLVSAVGAAQTVDFAPSAVDTLAGKIDPALLERTGATTRFTLGTGTDTLRLSFRILARKGAELFTQKCGKAELVLSDAASGVELSRLPLVSFQDTVVSLIGWQTLSLPLSPFATSLAGKPLALTPAITGLRSDRPLIVSLGHIYRGPEKGSDSAASLKKATLPASFDLAQNYPNPFNPSTTLRFALPEAAKISLVIYDILGREVVHLADDVYGPGYHEVIWNAHTSRGATVASGVYFARFEVQNAFGARVFTKTTKLLLTR